MMRCKSNVLYHERCSLVILLQKVHVNVILELLDHKSQNDLSLLGTMDHRLQQLTSIQLESHFDAAATNSLTNSLSFCLHQL
jgi:hypothetical protein